MKKWIVPLLVILTAAYFLISLFFAYEQHREFIEIQHKLQNFPSIAQVLPWITGKVSLTFYSGGKMLQNKT